MLTQDETRQLIELLAKASPRDSLAGSYTVIVSPTLYSPDDFIPCKRVYVDDVTNVVGILNVEDVMDAQAMGIKQSSPVTYIDCGSMSPEGVQTFVNNVLESYRKHDGQHTWELDA